MRRLSLPATGAVLLLLAACAGPVGEGTAPSRSGGPSVSAAPEPATAPGRLARLLAGVRMVPEMPYHAGYDRSCAAGHACVFGREWTDDHPGPFGHNGCDTRQDVLLAQMRDIEMRWGSSCRIYDGTLVDPYTGRRLTWRDDGYSIQVDHVYPLAAAWHGGAWSWPQQRRLRFANDVRRELLAVSARANQDKGAGTPGDWLPPRRAYRCRYLTKYLTVALAYDLPLTRTDADAVRATAGSC